MTHYDHEIKLKRMRAYQSSVEFDRQLNRSIYILSIILLLLVIVIGALGFLLITPIS